MKQLSKSKVRSAVSAIIEKEQREGTLSPLHINERNQLWIRRNLRKHLEPVLIGGEFDKERANQLLARHREEVESYLQKQEKRSAKQASAISKAYRRAWDNRRAALKHLGNKPYTLAPTILDQPFSIFTFPSAMLVEDNIESGNSWAKLLWSDDQDIESKDVSVRFFFVWENPNDYLAVINIRASLIARGQCKVSAYPGLFLGGWSSLFLTTQLRAHLSGTVIGGNAQEQKITSLGADTWGSIVGGDKSSDLEDIFSEKNLAIEQIIVEPRQMVIIDVKLLAIYYIDNGRVDLVFARDHPYVACPAVTIEVLSAPLGASA
jgi:hypothetical protein